MIVAAGVFLIPCLFYKCDDCGQFFAGTGYRPSIASDLLTFSLRKRSHLPRAAGKKLRRRVTFHQKPSEKEGCCPSRSKEKGVGFARMLLSETCNPPTEKNFLLIFLLIFLPVKKAP